MKTNFPGHALFNLQPVYSIEKKSLAVMMPFKDELLSVYQALQKAAKTHGFDCTRADDIWKHNAIIQDILLLICEARIVICDLTGKNPNVFYEVGAAHALGKEVILITQSPDDVPFDLRHLRCIEYQNNVEGLEAMVRRVFNRIDSLCNQSADVLTGFEEPRISTPKSQHVFQTQSANRFVKADVKGMELPDDATSWACVYDTQNKLLWELKTQDGGVRDAHRKFRWGGLNAEGREDKKRVGDYYDDWNRLLEIVNDLELGKQKTWRVPTMDELKTLVDVRRKAQDEAPYINTYYFSDVEGVDSIYYWSVESYTENSEGAWALKLNSGSEFRLYRQFEVQVRLVASSQ